MSSRPNRQRPKILIASLGTRGDVQPYASLARALHGLGADVVLATGEGFDDMIRAAGARPLVLPINYQTLLGSTATQKALHSLRGMVQAARDTTRLQQEVAGTLYRETLNEKPDLILFNVKAATITIAARKLGVPALPTCLQPILAATSDYPIALFGLPNLGSFGNRASWWAFRKLFYLGIGPLLKFMSGLSGEDHKTRGDLMDGFDPHGGAALSLQGYSSALVPNASDWPAHVRSTGYWFTEPDAQYSPPPELAAFLESGPPPIYVGFGSMPSKDPQGFTQMILNGLERGASRAILSTGWGGLAPHDLPETLRSRVHVLEKAPHSWLFPKCAAIVHHGGSGTTHEALRWGKPSFISPVFGDQPFWGKQVATIGAGPAPIKQKHLTAETFAQALKDLEQPTYRQNAEKAASVMAGEPGAASTARLLMEAYFQTTNEPVL